MTRASLPAAGEQIEVSTSDERSYTTWVDQSDGRYMSVFAPHDLLVVDLPGAGTVVTVRWHSIRGRHHVDAVFLERRGDGGLQWILEVQGDLRVTQDRQFVRGAGGEPLTLVRVATQDEDAADEPASELHVVPGVVVDLSERGVRARVESLDVVEQDTVSVVLTLDEAEVSVTGTVLRLFPGAKDVAPELVVVFETDDATATTIRRYVLQSQLRARQLADG